MRPSDAPSNRESLIASALAALGGAVAGWYLWVYLQGRYHLYEGFNGNEFFEAEGGLKYLGAALPVWALAGALSGFLLLRTLAWTATARRKLSRPETFSLLRWIGVPSISLAVHPLLGLMGVPATLIPIFHGIVAFGITAGLSLWAILELPETGQRVERFCLVIMSALILVHFILLAWLNIRQFHALNLGYSDSGQVEESLSQTLRGNFMVAHNQYNIEPGPGTSMEHLFLTRLAFIPVYWLFPYQESLLVLNALVLSLSAFPAYLLAKHVLKCPLTGLAFGAALLVYPPLIYVNFRSSYGPDEEAQGVLFLLCACYSLSRGRYRWAFFWCVMTISVKENFAPMAAMFGFLMARERPARRLGLGLTVGSVVYFLVGTKFLLPIFFTRDGYGFVMRYYAHLGHSIPEIAWQVLSRPDRVLTYIAKYPKISFLLHLFTPLLLLSFFAPVRLAVLLPSVLFLLLSGSSLHHSILFWNHSILIPVVFFSAVYGAQRVCGSLSDRRGPFGNPVPCLAVSVLLCSAVSGYLFLYRMQTPATFEVTPRAALVKEIKELIPRESSVLTTWRLGTHFAGYGKLNLAARYLPDDQDFLVFDALDRFAKYEEALKARDAALRNPEYGLVYRKDGFLVFKKGASRDDLWKDILIDSVPELHVRANQLQVDSAKLLGWRLNRGDSRSITVESFWECVRPPTEEYEVLVRIRFPDGEIRSSRHLMAQWLYPTSIWEAGDLVRDTVRIVFDREVPPDFQLAVSLVRWSRN